ncbi:myristoyl-CoA:protein N-myristoyltransferase [Kipferlia bialata]|uniref:Glycylpeptide N-tetradecanoyltransferase n=1 Tax=Kipferlia bialata TaxID=797122 RepID=A0A9K3D0P6_9EUKA|nr:myristoyl-CoA:protein N-myristoyltransferase [Kipferlia bialata]|eukprot:g6756.t1
MAGDGGRRRGGRRGEGREEGKERRRRNGNTEEAGNVSGRGRSGAGRRPVSKDPMMSHASRVRSGRGDAPVLEEEKVDIAVQMSRFWEAVVGVQQQREALRLRRFAYSKDIILHDLTGPGCIPDYRLGVRDSEKSLVGFIAAVPGPHCAGNPEASSAVPMVEINFLCVTSHLRNQGMAPLLIKEITRRVNVNGTFQAIYTAGVPVTAPVCVANYYHRTLNALKLLETEFTYCPPRMSQREFVGRYRMPSTPRLTGFRPMTKKDMPQAQDLLQTYLRQFRFHPEVSKRSFQHKFKHSPGVTQTYVIERDGAVVGFGSFYTVDTQVLQHSKHSVIRAAYLHHCCVADGYGLTRTDMMRDLLIAASASGHDVFNSLNIADNEEFLDTLRFGRGNGKLYYYVFNWKWGAPATARDVAVVLV